PKKLKATTLTPPATGTPRIAAGWSARPTQSGRERLTSLPRSGLVSAALEESDTDQREQRQSHCDQRECQRLGRRHHPRRRRVNQFLLQLAAIDQALVLHAMVGLELFQRHGTREHHDFDRELVWPEMVVEEVH